MYSFISKANIDIPKCVFDRECCLSLTAYRLVDLTKKYHQSTLMLKNKGHSSFKPNFLNIDISPNQQTDKLKSSTSMQGQTRCKKNLETQPSIGLFVFHEFDA
jgi:hypothetical protein